MTQAEGIFGVLVGQAVGPDLKAKRLLFDILIKLQRANVCWPQDRPPEVELDDSEDAGAQVAAEMERLADRMRGEGAARSVVPRNASPEAPADDGTEPLPPSRPL